MDDSTASGEGKATLRLFVMGRSDTMRRAVRNARTLGDVEVIDVRERPDLAEADRVLATPVLIRSADGEVVRIVGDLRDLDAVRRHLGLLPDGEEAKTPRGSGSDG